MKFLKYPSLTNHYKVDERNFELNELMYATEAENANHRCLCKSRKWKLLPLLQPLLRNALGN